jgi:hypothetical protein
VIVPAIAIGIRHREKPSNADKASRFIGDFSFILISPAIAGLGHNSSGKPGDQLPKVEIFLKAAF